MPAGEGVEAAARRARYAAFAGLDGDVLALAQQRDDQAETVLAQLLRGGDLRGLAAMPASRPLAGSALLLWRPLLGVPRARLEAWARARDLAWIEDESNRDERFTRNALRHRVVPVLESVWPGSAEGLARASARFAEAAGLLDDLADLDLAALAPARGLSLPGLAALGEARARNVLRRFVELAGGRVRHNALAEALRQLLDARAEAQPAVPFGSIQLRRHRDRVHAVPRSPAPIPPSLIWQGESRLDMGESGVLGFTPVPSGGVALVPGRVRVAPRQGGESLRPGPGRPRRPLKDLLREAGLPPWSRHGLPLLCQDGRLVWAAGVGPDADALAGPGQPGWLISWDSWWSPGPDNPACASPPGLSPPPGG